MAIHVRVGGFFTGVVGGCSCGDGLMPVQVRCDLRVEIDKADAVARFVPLWDR